MTHPAATRTLLVSLASLMAASVLCLACGDSSQAPAPAPAATPPAAPAPAAVTADAAAQASEIFATRCTPCHGAQGKGDGAASAGLTPPPRDFQDAAWQDSVTDEHIEKIVKYGGAAVGKSPAMPANPDLTAKPDVVKALRAHVRSLRAPAP